MSVVGVADAVIAPLVRAVSGEVELDGNEVADRFARAAWSTITEPGDGDAGALIETLGVRAALERIIGGADVRQLSADLRAAGLDVTTDHWESALKRWSPRMKSDAVLLSLKQAARFGARMLIAGDDMWPAGLDELGQHAPHALWARGDVARLSGLDRSIAIVGARAATGYGEHVTVEASSGLVDRGFTIVSGAAYGIDGIAHRAALASQGTTVAVLAGGLDRFYPSGHEQLLTRVVDRGVVLSEVPCGTAPTKWRFLQRNRLIAAISGGTVIIEAGWRSGSINTATHAIKLGRPVGAVPGPVTSAASAGCHRLLREGYAVCVTGPEEMAELVPYAPAASAGHGGEPVPLFDPTGTRVRILDALSDRSGRRVDGIATITGLAIDRVRAELGLLELEGLVHERPSGWMKPRAKDKDEAGEAEGSDN